MRTNAKIFDPFEQEFVLPEGVSPRNLDATVNALRMSVRIKNVIGTAIGGALSGSDKIFTRTTGYFIDRVIIPISGIVATETESNFRVGEHVVETTSNADGIVVEVTPTQVVLKTITVAQFTGNKTLTGQSSTVTATGGTVTEKLTDLSNKLAWVHVSGTPAAGELTRIISNTATTFTTLAAMFTGGTAVILFDDADAAVAAMQIEEVTPKPMMSGELVAATATLDGTEGAAAVLPINCAEGAVALTLPDVRAVPEDQQYAIVGVDVETAAFTLVSPVAAQTLDGTDISSGGTPFADMDANGDFIIIRRSGGVWVTMTNGVQ